MHYSPRDLGAIAAGGVAGATARWLITRRGDIESGWFVYSPGPDVTMGFELGIPGRTLIANVIGCLLLGGFTLALHRAVRIPRRLLIGSATGFCGSLTTFSTFAVEIAERLRGHPALIPGSAVDPIDHGRQVGSAMTYLIISLVAGGVAFWLGRTLAGRIVTPPGGVTIGGGE